MSLVIEGKLIFTKQSFTGKRMHEKSKEKNATGENVVSFNTLNSAAIKKHLVETWDKINIFITSPFIITIISSPLIYKHYKHSRCIIYVING